MKQIWFPGIMGVVSVAMFCAYCASLHDAEADPMDAALMQSPVPAAIHQEIAAHAGDKPPMTSAQRQDLFAERFTERFRMHEPKMAVRARFEEISHARNRIKLMCPARLEPWNMDRIALSAWREAKDCLGENCDIDLYETFIGSAPRKIGELRNAGGAKSVADIHYLPHAQVVNDAGDTVKAQSAKRASFYQRAHNLSFPADMPAIPAHSVITIHP